MAVAAWFLPTNRFLSGQVVRGVKVSGSYCLRPPADRKIWYLRDSDAEIALSVTRVVVIFALQRKRDGRRAAPPFSALGAQTCRLRPFRSESRRSIGAAGGSAHDGDGHVQLTRCRLG